MTGQNRQWTRQGEAFWRTHHEAWKHSELNQREYCEAHAIPLKAFGNWRAKFMAEPQPVQQKLLYRRGRLSHMTKDPVSRPIVPLGQEGRRRNFSDEDKRRIVEEATQPGASLSGVARSYGIAPRLLFRWKQEFAATDPVFVSVEISDEDVFAGGDTP